MLVTQSEVRGVGGRTKFQLSSVQTSLTTHNNNIRKNNNNNNNNNNGTQTTPTT